MLPPSCLIVVAPDRGERYGLRIVGSLKSQPALNVLAIYDK
jgi:hypothetical protein